MKTNMKQWCENIRTEKKRSAMPIMTHPGIEKVGTTIQKAVTDGEIHFEVVKSITETYPTVAATMMMDLSVEAEAFGSPVRFFDHEIPSITLGILNDAASIDQLAIPSLSCGRLSEYLKAAELISSHISDRPVFGCCIGPFSLASRLYGLTEIMTAILIEPDTIHTLLEKTTQFLSKYAAAFKTAGTNGLIIAEPASGMLSEDLCQTFSSDYVKKIVDAVQDDHFMMILHNCGDTNTLLDSMQSTGAMGLHFGNKCDIVRALDHLNPERILFGNLDPTEVFKLGTSDQIKNLTTDLIRRTFGHGNFVLSSGCDIPPGVPEENIRAFFDAITEPPEIA
jgi:uroporphyrinogen decarboxylase